MDTNALHLIIRQIYAAVGNAVAWHIVGEQMARYFNAMSGSVLFVDDKYPQGSFGISSGYDQTDVAWYFTEFYAIDPMQNFIKANTCTQIVSATDITPLHQLRRHPFHAFMKHYRFDYCLGGAFMQSANRYGFFSVERNRDFGRDDFNAMALLKPHLFQAANMHSEWVAMKLAEECNIARPGKGIALLSPQGMLLYCNRVFRGYLDKGVFREAKGCLHLVDPLIGFSARLKRAHELGYAPGKSYLDAFKLTDASGEQLYVLIRPFVLSDQVVGPFVVRECVLVSIVELAPHATSNSDIMRQVFSLTPMELRVLQLLLEGDSSQQISERLSISLEAVRFHLKNLFRKTDVRRQMDLVRIANSF